MRADDGLHNDDLDSVTSQHSNDSTFGCSSAAGAIISGGLFRLSTVRTSTPPARSDSPICLPSKAASPPPLSKHKAVTVASQHPAVTASLMAASTTTNVVNKTPLLKASLNAPVAAYYTSYRGKSDVGAVSSHGAVSSQASSISILATTKHKPDDFNGLSNVQSSFYSSLVHQLRAKTGQSSDSAASSKPLYNSSHMPTNKMNGSKKAKDKADKSLPFVCQVCKKRFQRHIALNAHFQNEHITAGTQSGERSCKLCGASASGLSGIRLHLRSAHNIDLDNPMKCLEDSKNSPSLGLGVTSTPSPIILEVCTRPTVTEYITQEEAEPSCSNIEMYESESPPATSPARTPSSSNSPERSLFPFKSEVCQPQNNIEEEDPQVEDLCIRKPSPVLSRRCSPVPGAGSSQGRSPSPSTYLPAAKRQRGDEEYHQLETGLNLSSSAKNLSSSVINMSNTTCGYCNIVYPNQTLYFLHRGFHSESDPWRCNSCGHLSSDLYDFNTHLFSAAHK